MTFKKVNVNLNFKSNERHLKFIRPTLTRNLIKLTTLIRCIWGKRGLWELVALRSLLTLKKGTRNSNLQSNEPSPKFILPSVPKKNLLCPQGTIYNTCPQVLLGCAIPCVFFIVFSVYFEQNNYINNSIGGI